MIYLNKNSDFFIIAAVCASLLFAELLAYQQEFGYLSFLIIACVFILFISKKYSDAALLLIISIVFLPDTSYLIEEGGDGGVYNIHAMKLGPVSFIGLISILYIGKDIFFNKLDKLTSVLLGALLFYAVIGLPNLMSQPNTYYSDSSHIITIMGGVLLAKSILNDYKIHNFIAIVSAVFFGKNLATIFHAASIFDISQLTYYHLDTSYYILPFLMAYSFYRLSLNEGQESAKLFHLMSIFIGVLTLLIGASRGRFLLLAVICLPLILRKSVLRSFGLALPLMGVAVGLIFQYYPSIGDFISWKFMTFDVSEDSSVSTITRIIEFNNIVGKFYGDTFEFFFGGGLGGYFTDALYPFPFNLYGAYAYPDEWITVGRYYKPHSGFLNSLLKYGIIGVVFFLGWAIYSGIKFIYIKSSDSSINGLYVVYSMVLFWIYAFNGKMSFILGVLVFFVWVNGRYETGVNRDE